MLQLIDIAKIIVLTATPNNLLADGKSTSSISAFVSDEYGNAIVDGETITFILTGSGRFSTTGYTQATASTQAGIAAVDYIAGTVTGTDTIVATANASGITQFIPVTLIDGDIVIDSVTLQSSKQILYSRWIYLFIKRNSQGSEWQFCQ
jgi:Bacterial Ig-like domain (group 1).